MKGNKTKVNTLIILVLILILLGVAFVLKANGQEGTFQGGDSENSDMSVSFTIGQTFYSYNLGEFQGMQQSVAVPDTTPTDVDEKLLESLKIYPNPFTTYVRVETFEQLEYEIYDIYGKLLRHGKTGKDIEVSNLVPAPYFLKVKQEGDLIKVTKLLKR